MTRRRWLRSAALRALALAGVLAAGGCVSIGGGDAPSRVWYQMSDRDIGGNTAAAVASAATTSRIDTTLLVEGTAASPLYEGTALVYSRSPGAHAVYQFAAWTEPPARRIAHLAARRLAARDRFDTVAQTDTGIRGALVLRISVERVLHEIGPSASRARLELTAELLDWRRRTLIARQGFAAHEAVGSDDAAAAVAAFDRGLARVLDDLTPWVETAAARWSRP